MQVIVGVDAREVVMTGLSSATIYEFCVCALTKVGQGEMSDITKPIKTLSFSKPAPGYAVLKTDLNLVALGPFVRGHVREFFSFMDKNCSQPTPQ